MTSGTRTFAIRPGAGDLTVAVIGLVGGTATDHCAGIVRGPDTGSGATVATIPQGNARTATIPARRFAALRSARTALVAFVEDTTLPQAGWAEALLEGFADPAVVGAWGPIAVSPALGARYRALGRLEYGRFDGTGPVPAAPPGNTMAFRRDALLGCLTAADDGITEAVVAERLTRAGGRIAFLPGARADYAVADRHGARLATRFSHGRLYAGTRHAPADLAGRAAGAAKALLVPAVLTLRGLQRAMVAGPARQWLAEAPWIAAMALACGAGELVGYVFGKGQSDREWR